MSDIDIEWLREAARRVRHNYESGRMNRGWGVPTVLEAVDWLLELADEGGELWMKTKCPHGYDSHAWIEDGESKGCNGSRVRVWPKEKGE